MHPPDLDSRYVKDLPFHANKYSKISIFYAQAKGLLYRRFVDARSCTLSLDQDNRDDHTAIRQVINKCLQFTRYQKVEEYALCEFIPMRCSGLECMVKGITMENAFIR
jgi:hypothetical protein